MKRLAVGALLLAAACGAKQETEPPAGAASAPSASLPAGRGAIAGHVVGAEGPVVVTLRRVTTAVQDAPKYGARSRLHADWDRDGPALSITTAADGEFRFDGLPCGDYLASLRTPLGDDVEEQIRLRDEEPRSGVTLQVRGARGTAEVRGRVVADGAPVAGARVAWEPFAWELARDRPSVRTDDEGRFAVRGLAFAEGTVTVSADGRWSRSTCATGAGDIDPFEGAAPLAVRVVVRGTGAPVAGATVVAGSSSHDVSGWLRYGSVTDADGRATLRALPLFTGIEVEADGFLDGALSYAVRPGDVAVAIDPVRSLDVPVVDAATGAPVVGARVGVSLAPRDGMQTATTGEDGVAHVTGLPAALVRAHVIGGGWVTERTPTQSAESDPEPGVLVSCEGATPRVLPLRAVRSVTVRGRVEGVDGSGLAGAVVSAQDSGGPNVGPGRVPGWGRAVTAADGSFEIADLTPGATVSLWVENARQTLSLDGGDVVGIVLRMRSDPSESLEAVVRDESGAPVAGALVRASVKGDAEGTRDAWGSTDADGRVRLGPLPAGRCTVKSEGAEPAAFDLVGGGAAGPVTLVAPIRASLEFRVEDSDGVALPAGSANLRILRKTPNGGGQAYARIGPDGVVRAADLFAGEWEASVMARRGRTRFHGTATLRTGAAGQRVVVTPKADVKEPRRIRVVGPDGRDVPRASWQLHQAPYWTLLGNGGGSLHGGANASRADGIEEDETLGWGRPDALLEVWGARSASDVPLGFGGTVGPVPADGIVRLPAERRVRGVVTTPDGRPVAGVAVIALPRPADLTARTPSKGPHYLTSRRHGVAVTDAEGRFEVGGIGAVRTVVVVPQSRGYEDSAEVEASGDALLRLVVSPRTR